MANVTIGGLTAASAFDLADVVEIEQGGASRKVSKSVMNAPRGALAYRSTDLTAQNFTTMAAVSNFNAESWDSDNCHDLVTNPGRLTVPTGVTWVRMSAGLALANVSVDLWVVALVGKNGATTGYPGRPRVTGEIGTTNPGLTLVSCPLQVTAGDYFDVFLQVETDTSIDVLANSWFCLEILA